MITDFRKIRRAHHHLFEYIEPALWITAVDQHPRVGIDDFGVVFALIELTLRIGRQNLSDHRTGQAEKTHGQPQRTAHCFPRTGESLSCKRIAHTSQCQSPVSIWYLLIKA